MSQLHELALALPVAGGWVALAIPVRIAGGRLIGAVWSYRSQRPVRWSGRHGLPDRLVAAVEAGRCTVAELDEIAPRPATEDVALAEVVLSEEEQRQVDATHAVLVEARAEAAEAGRRAGIVAVLQEKTAAIPVIKQQELDAVLRTRAELADPFDRAYRRHDVEFATALGIFLNDNAQLLAELGVARMYRGWTPSQTGEHPIVPADTQTAGAR